MREMQNFDRLHMLFVIKMGKVCAAVGFTSHSKMQKDVGCHILVEEKSRK